MRIYVDVDEVLCDTLQSFCVFYNKRFRTDYCTDDFHTYKWWEILGCTKEDCYALLLEFWEEVTAMGIAPINGAREALMKLSGQHELSVLTARAIGVETETRKYIESHYPGIFSNVYFAKGHINVPERQTKDEIIMRKGKGLMIEDDLAFALAMQERSIPVVLLARPWNRQSNGIPRLDSWPQIVDYIKDFKYCPSVPQPYGR
jgi:uncharacterized HAD superfamily protein